MLSNRLSSLPKHRHHAIRQLSTSRSSRFRLDRPRHEKLLMGCVSYDPSVNTIWTGIASYLNRTMGSEIFDFCLFTNYETQVSALADNHIDIAWNGPIAHVMAERAASAHSTAGESRSIVSLGMRDVDRDFRSILVARKEFGAVQSLQGQRVLAGAWDSPQANLIPLYWLQSMEGVAPREVTEFNLDIGKHGDTALGEIMLLRELSDNANLGSNESGGAAGAVLSKMMWDRAIDGKLEGVEPNVLKEHYHIMESAQIPTFDHCQFDAIYDPVKTQLLSDFSAALMEMDMKDPEQKHLMCLEGITKEWVAPRQEGYEIARKALDASTGMAASHNYMMAANLFTDKSSFLLNQRGNQRNHHQQIRSFSSASSGAGTNQRPKTIAVIGSGVAGLQTARALRSHGFHVTCFDANSKVGGLWNSNYSNFSVQVPKQLYEIQDFPMTEVKEGEYPSAVQVQSYLERMVKEFQLQDVIQLNTSVESVNQNEDGTWDVTTKQFRRDEAVGTQECHSFDYLVSATGLYSNRDAYVPSIDGANKYQGQIIHSSQFTDATIANGKRVIVVGGAKSAIDCAIEAHRAGATQVTLLARKAHWPTPRKIAGLIPFQYIFLSRFGTALVSAHRGVYPAEGSGMAVSLFRKFGWPIVGGAFYAVEALFRLQLSLFGDRNPTTDVVDDFYGYAHVLNTDLQELIKNKAVNFKIGQISRYLGENSVEISNGRDTNSMDADIIIFATGYKPNYSIFDESTLKRLNIEQDGLYLYHRILPPHVKNLAFIGKAATISNISSYGIQAEWLARMLKGSIPEPTTSTMEAEIAMHKKWSRSWMPQTSSRASLVLLHQTHYHDDLLRDMGENPLRKSNVVEEYFGPYQPRDYNGIMALPPGAATTASVSV